MTTKPNQNQRNINISGRKITAIGARKNLFADFYHASMTSNWRTFIACALLVFLSLNAIFAALFALQPNSIANIPDGKNWYVIYFSIETLATVGYGDMHPATDYAHLVASTETFIGLLFSAVLTGLIFARFAQPRVRILASNAILISQHNDQPTLMLRVANERLNNISDASARLWMMYTETSAEGQSFRRFVELQLTRNNQPMLILTWAIFHTIDASSPLFGRSQDDFANMDLGFVLIITGNDESIAQEVRSRHTYDLQQIKYNHQFVDVLSVDASGKTTVNYNNFHLTTPNKADNADTNPKN